MTSVVERKQCPVCMDTGRDNLVMYADGGSHCFACGYTEQSDNVVNMDEYKSPQEQIKFISGNFETLATRGISEATCRKYNYTVGRYNGNKAHIANYYDRWGSVVAQKVRMANKNMSCVGKMTDATLFGQQLYNPSKERFVVITEGEIDALSVSEVCGSYYPVVSLKNGAAGAKKDIEANLEWLSGFKHVVLGFDMDEAGDKATKECVSLLDPSKVRIARWTRKDANEMLKEGDIKLIKDCVWQAQPYTPDSILTVSDVLERGLEKPSYGVDWPWPELTSITYGIRSKSIYTIGAGSGVGKTEFLKEVTLHLTQQCNAAVACMFLESSVNDIVLRLAGGMQGKRLHIPGQEWNVEEIEKTLEPVKDKVYLYDIAEEGESGSTWETIKGKIRYFCKSLGVKYIVLDHLTALCSHMQDERKSIDKMMAELGSMVHELDCTLFLVSHLAKPTADGASYEEGRPVSAASFRGSQSIQYWSSFMIGLERNKVAEDEIERNILKLRVLKDRFSGEADGFVLKLKYNKDNSKLEVYEEQVNFEDDVL